MAFTVFFRSLARFTAKFDLPASLLSEVGGVPKPFFFVQEVFFGWQIKTPEIDE